MSEPLKRLEAQIVQRNADGTVVTQQTTEQAKINELIDRINELEARYESHTHGSSELLYDTYAARDNLNPAEAKSPDSKEGMNEK